MKSAIRTDSELPAVAVKKKVQTSESSSWSHSMKHHETSSYLEPMSRVLQIVDGYGELSPFTFRNEVYRLIIHICFLQHVMFLFHSRHCYTDAVFPYTPSWCVTPLKYQTRPVLSYRYICTCKYSINIFVLTSRYCTESSMSWHCTWIHEKYLNISLCVGYNGTIVLIHTL